MSEANLKTGKFRAWFQHYAGTLKYALHVIVRPFDGFWDLNRERRGSLAAANTFVILTLMTQVLKIQYTNFQFLTVHLEHVNLLTQCLAILFPLLVYVAANWCFTTLFEGKGTIRDIYIGVGYSLVPFILIQLPMILLSQVLSKQEGAFYTVFGSISLLWCALLFIVAMMQIHDYSLGKTLAFTFISLFGMLIIVFLLLLFFSLLSDFANFFSALYKETLLRMN